MTCRQTLMFKLFWYTYIHSNRVDIYVNGVTNSLHIMTSIASTSISCIMQDMLANAYAHCDFLLLVSIILAANQGVSGLCSCE